MILGIGTDLVTNTRVKKLYQKYGDRFLNKILSGTSPKKDDCGFTPKGISISLYNMRNFSNATDEINHILKMFALEASKCSGQNFRDYFEY